MISLHEYEDVRHTCHSVKEGKANFPLLIRIAREIENAIGKDDNAVIVPVPSHVGYATYTRKIAEMTGLKVEDCIVCVPHESLYERKKRGEVVNPSELHFFLTCNEQDLADKKVYILDLVYATGVTTRAAQKLFSYPTEMIVYAKDSKCKTV